MPCSRSPEGFPGPQPRGKLREIWSRPTAKGEVEGNWSRPTPNWEVEGDLPWGHWSQGVPALGGCLVETPWMATVAGGMHPTGMHSCPKLNQNARNGNLIQANCTFFH